MAGPAFLHGVEIFEYTAGPVPVTVLGAAVVGIVGSAPLFAVPGALPLWSSRRLVQAQPGWAASTMQQVGSLIVDTNGNTQKCTTAGVTGTSPPFFGRTLNATTNDGTASWTLIAVGASAGYQIVDSRGNVETVTGVSTANYATGTAYVVSQLAIDGNGNTQRCLVAGTSGGTAPTWSTTLGASTTDNTVTWVLVAIGRAGLTGTTQPTWTGTLNATIVDGTATWTTTQLGPIANLQTPTLVLGANPNSLAPGQTGTFGPMIQGYTIPYALNQVFQQGAGQCIVVNVFDQTKHFTSLSAQSLAFPATGVQAINLGHMGVSGVVVTNVGATITYLQGADYTVDRTNGVITALGGGLIAAGQSVLVTYNYADPSKIVDADLVGTVTTGVYTGIQAWRICYSMFGFFPKLLIAPSYDPAIGQSVGSQDATVAAALASVAIAMRSVYFVDCAAYQTPQQLLVSRGTAGSSFNSSDRRAYLCGPHVLFSDSGLSPTGVSINPVTGATIQNAVNLTRSTALSPFVAGATSGNDAVQGYWWGPSNLQLNGPLGTDVNLYASPIDPNNDANNLNAQGIGTVFQAYATGYRSWGNRSAAFPTYSSPDTFLAVRRIMDGVEQSLQVSMFQFLDQPITNGLISTILASANGFLATMVGRGALIAGTATFNTSENPPAQIANGQLVFDISCIPAIPAERLTFNVTLDTTLLTTITAVAA